MKYNFIVICYVDDCCTLYKGKETIDALLKNLSKIFKMTIAGYVKYDIGMNVSKYPNGTINMSHTSIIDKSLNSLGICDESKI